MLRTLFCTLSAFWGSAAGALLHGLWFVAFFWGYSLILGPFVLFEIAFLGNATVEDPLSYGLVIGGTLGCVLGLISGIWIAIRQPRTLVKSVLLSLMVTVLVITGLFFFIETTNVHPLYVPFAVAEDATVIAILWLFLLIPSALNGASIEMFNRALGRLLRLQRPAEATMETRAI